MLGAAIVEFYLNEKVRNRVKKSQIYAKEYAPLCIHPFFKVCGYLPCDFKSLDHDQLLQDVIVWLEHGTVLDEHPLIFRCTTDVMALFLCKASSNLHAKSLLPALRSYCVDQTGVCIKAKLVHTLMMF